ncbi:hypothetical protein Sste5346_005877 [Sporothrix stenoceras]|uniref:Uncharacterized protein n=1 Tax=Sporothrix stenoceras TaxID=5173 RepID=A0ABR3Z279_9PEZI
MQQAHGSLSSPQREPTLQEMYNTWRSLEEQFSQMRRLPMFVKAELKFCHACRILKTRCTCFDYSQLEVGYQERDRVLRHAALREFPIEGGESEEVEGVKTEPTATESVVGTPSTTLTGPPTTPITHQSPALGNSMPTVVKFELRTIIMAKEKIGAQSRRWQCQYGLSDDPSSPVCKREDDNMDTIRRHYGREHGSHRYHKKPALRIRCSHCGLEYDKQRPPIKCPGCKVDRGIWLREIFAVIEVPVPLNSQEDGNGGSGPTYPGGGSSSFGGLGGPVGPGAGDAGGPYGAGGHGSVGVPGSSSRPGGFPGAQVHSIHSACAQQIGSCLVDMVKYDPDTGMPECYNDICNNTAALAVMPPPSVLATPGNTQTHRPSSSSSSSTAQTHPVSMSRSLSQAQSPFTQGFYAVGRGLPLSPSGQIAYAIATPTMSPGLPMSPTSPASNASSAYDAETPTASVASNTEHLGMATGGQGRAHALASSPSTQQPAPSATVSMADVQKFMDMSVTQVAPAVSSTRNRAVANNSSLRIRKCSSESEFYYFAD